MSPQYTEAEERAATGASGS